MSERIHALAQVLLGKTSLNDCNIEEIQHLTKRYPYFAPAQFLLLQKLAATGAPEAAAQQQKAVLFFHDPLQFDHFIHPEHFRVDEENLHTGHATDASEAFVTAEEYPMVDTLLTEDESLLQQEAITPALRPYVASEPSPKNPADELDEQIDEVAETPHYFTEKLPEGENETEPANPEEIKQEADFAPVIPAPFEAQEEDKMSTAGEEKEVIPDREENVSEQQATPIDQSAAAAEPITATTENHTFSFGKSIANGLASAQAPVGETELTFEPYHTVDYFASQGIKISAEELPKDRLGKQLRSFTEWLKVMKRLPATEIAVSPESPSEKSVENLASHSVVESDVVTEAMAEVWLKQGNRQKAVETYNKLSLLNPSKKAYFAAKIENLKGS